MDNPTIEDLKFTLKGLVGKSVYLHDAFFAINSIDFKDNIKKFTLTSGTRTPMVQKYEGMHQFIRDLRDREGLPFPIKKAPSTSVPAVVSTPAVATVQAPVLSAQENAQEFLRQEAHVSQSLSDQLKGMIGGVLDGTIPVERANAVVQAVNSFTNLSKQKLEMIKVMSELEHPKNLNA